MTPTPTDMRNISLQSSTVYGSTWNFWSGGRSFCFSGLIGTSLPCIDTSREYTLVFSPIFRHKDLEVIAKPTNLLCCWSSVEHFLTS